MGERDDLHGWLPTGIIFTASGVSVRWIEFGDKRLSEPFFPQTIRKLRMSEPPARERVTGAEALVTHARTLPPAPPAVVILHVSRCGSTLLGNALGTGERVLVLSEARPVSALVNINMSRTGPPSAGIERMRRAVLDAVLRTCAYHHHGGDTKPVVKCNASTLLWMTELREVWPDTQFVILVRNPVEVMVSNILRPAGWMRARHVALDSRSLFGWSGVEVQQMTDEEYCARGLSAFCNAARRQRDSNCTVIDYEDLSPERIGRLAKTIGITLPRLDSDSYQKVFKTCAKDVDQSATYQDDRSLKTKQATESIKEAAAEWAEEPYRALLAEAEEAPLRDSRATVVH